MREPVKDTAPGYDGAMPPSALLTTRLRRQRLIDSPCRGPEEVVSWLGAVQAQDYAGAAWALALRAPGVTLADVDAAMAAGTILRTHVLRPTWHFVAPADIRWMLALTAPRVHALMRTYDARLELDAKVYGRARTLFTRALERGHPRTRGELAEALRRGGIEAAGQRLAHLVMHAELEGDICSGPRRGAQFTYGLLAERAPGAALLPRDEALAALAQRYFRSHGPATVRDFAWWSGLTMADARQGAEAAGAGEVLTAPPEPQHAAGAHFLLPNYDEFVIAYRDRGAVIDPARARNLGVFTTAEFPHQLVADGRVAGSWKREVSRGSARVSLQWYAPPTPRQRAAIAAHAVRFGEFLGVTGEVTAEPATS